MKEYKISKGWALIIYISTPLLIVFFGYLLIISSLSERYDPITVWLLIPVSTLMIILLVYGILETYISKFVIQENSIKSIRAFSKRELEFDQIKGFTVNEQYIFIEPKNDDKKVIKISTYISGYSEVIGWLSKNFPNLDIQNMKQEEQEILQNEQIGWTTEEREEKFHRQKSISKVVNWVGGLSAAWIIFYPKYYQFSIMIAIIIPIAALLLVKFSHGLIRIDERRGSAYPSIVYALLLPSVALTFRALLDFNIYSYSNVWLPSITMTLFLIIIMFFKQKEFSFKNRRDFTSAIILSVFLFAYSFGVVIHYNCQYDHSKAEQLTATVLDKRISTGNSTNYYLKLSTSEHQDKVRDVRISQVLYNRVEVGAEINVYLREGKLGIPWFIVSDR